MRTLLVDNHDSFTLNLFHQLAEVNGREPDVVRNDDPCWRPSWLDGFDNVVLSPGPGTPHRAADVGICADLVRTAARPVLGVCLGHQTIAAVHGARVGHAPEPCHGRCSPVEHDGTGLFAGLPAPFDVVRYHSLAVTALPASLAATAWTPDGVLMALAHRTLPLWGVQFHPESIGAAHGAGLLRNFRALTEHRAPRRRPHRPAAPAPGPAAPPGPAPEPPAGSRRLRILTERVGHPVDPEAAFDALFRAGRHPFWLDSALSGGDTGQQSIMGDGSGPLGRTVEADVQAGTVTVVDDTGPTVHHTGFLDWLERDLAAIRTEPADLPSGFGLGWVGYLGYELKAECDGDAVHRSPDPDAAMVFCDRALVLDHRDGAAHLLALAAPGDEGPARAWLAEAAATLAAAPVLPPPEPPADPVPVGLRHDRASYLDLVRRCQDAITDGETYEVCLTNMVEARVATDPWPAYRALRRASPAPFGAFLQCGALAVLSTSPERFLRVDPDGRVESRPIKGTRRRGATPAEDARLRTALANSEKDRAENLMIVDLVRHDLGRCAQVGSVTADPLFDVETFPAVHQLVSTVRARLRPGTGAVTAVRAAFPPGSMTGAPKIRTMQILDRLEGGARGVYSGAIGYLSPTGAADLSVVIRTAVLRGDRLRYGVGGAVIALSGAEAEFEETAVKAAPVLALLGAEFPGRTAAVPARDG